MTKRPLAERLPPRGEVDADDLLDRFLEWVVEQEIELYPAQEEAVLEVFAGNHLILETPTGSGKSLVAVASHFHALAHERTAVYTSPIKALVSEKFFDLCDTFGPDHVGMMTGDSTVNRRAPILCCTAEILANMALHHGGSTRADFVVMDEFHFYSDPDRGMAWQIPLLTLPHATFLLMSATLGDTTGVEQGIEELTGRPVSVVSSDDRPVPLEFSYRETPLHETVADLVAEGKSPIYQVNFTQRSCAEEAQNLMSANYCSREEKKRIAAELRGFEFDTPYGKDVQRYVRHGVGLHHGGLLPKYRLLVERLSRKGMLKVICGTDTLGVGVNVPIRTVLFTQLCKFDGEKTRLLTVRELRQISGRAGRKGFDERGFVVCQAPAHVIENRRMEQRAAGDMVGGRKKKFVRKKPPQKGFVPWNRQMFEELLLRAPEPLESTFSIDHGMIVHLMQREDAWASRHGGYGLLLDLIARSHERPATVSRLRRHARQVFRALVRAGILEVLPRQHGRGQEVLVAEGLQPNFSLFQTLSLFLLGVLELLDPASESYALDVMSMVEAICEHPRPVLYAQERKLRGELIAELKAAGVEYEERMERLEKVTWPKPKAELLYEAFDSFSEGHPWVADENIRPKSVARDMYERYTTFNDYVKELGLQPFEGVLLRYLSSAYKTLLQSVPEAHKTEEVHDVTAYLRTMIGRVDSSLVREWERMVLLRAEGVDPQAAPTEAAPKIDISRDERRFRARIRSELHLLVAALAASDWEEAARVVRQDEADPWTAERFEAALRPFLEDYERLLFDHSARLAQRTRIEPLGPHRWRVGQVLRDPEGDDLWGIEGVVDLRGDSDPPGPMVQVLHIGG